jgi:hypothetical protein
VRCYTQLRCICGQFVREDSIEQHLTTSCPIGTKALAAMTPEEREEALA